MAKRKPGTKKSTQAGNGQTSGIVTLTKELFQAAIAVRGLQRGAQVSAVERRYEQPLTGTRGGCEPG